MSVLLIFSISVTSDLFFLISSDLLLSSMEIIFFHLNSWSIVGISFLMICIYSWPCAKSYVLLRDKKFKPILFPVIWHVGLIWGLLKGSMDHGKWLDWDGWSSVLCIFGVYGNISFHFWGTKVWRFRSIYLQV